jgi:hypothetical protein
MARRGDCLQRPAVAGQSLAIGQHAIGGIVRIERGIGARAAVFQRQRRAADDRGAGQRREGREAGLWSRWVWVQTIAATRALPTAAWMASTWPSRWCRHGLGRLCRPGRIDHRHIGARADQVGLRAGEGVGRGLGASTRRTSGSSGTAMPVFHVERSGSEELAMAVLWGIPAPANLRAGQPASASARPSRSRRRVMVAIGTVWERRRASAARPVPAGRSVRRAVRWHGRPLDGRQNSLTAAGSLPGNGRSGGHGGAIAARSARRRTRPGD